MLSNPLHGLGSQRLERDGAAPTEDVMIVRPLQRILAFTGRSIDDVINNPIARNEVAGYYKLHRQIERVSEVVDLERQWNPLGVRIQG
jgi:hypothetical protein